MTRSELEKIVDRALFDVFKSKEVTIDNGVKLITEALINSQVIIVEPEPIKEFCIHTDGKNAYVRNQSVVTEKNIGWKEIHVHAVEDCKNWHEKWMKLKDWASFHLWIYSYLQFEDVKIKMEELEKE